MENGRTYDAYACCQGQVIALRYGNQPIQSYHVPIEHLPVRQGALDLSSRTINNLYASALKAGYLRDYR